MVARWPLVGRADELEEIEHLLTASGAPHGAALFGEAGVGKTRLLTDAIETLRARGVAVEWVRATEAAREIPLGSFAHVVEGVDSGPAPAHGDLLHAVLAGLRSRAGDGPFVLAVDDAHQLDQLSIALLHLAVTQTAIRVVMTVRTGGRLPEGLVGLWKDELLRRIDVGPLSRAATEELVLAVLGRGVTASLLDRIWQLSRGNVLFVRELVTTARERRSAGAGGPLASEGTQPRLRDLVEERLRLLSPARRAALEVVAVGEQVPLVAAERLVSIGDLEDLDARGLVEVVDAGGIDVVQLVHPLHGEVLVAGLTRLRRRAVLHDLVGAVADIDRFDRLRLATWQLESGRPGEPDLLLVLAREALGRLDHSLAERL
ncbi:MAG TPA: ATP-binding protein, partial [Acidimicrobiales bacterium]|nr:ATP-binding protein [Acidimicrobiales bacterium]